VKGEGIEHEHDYEHEPDYEHEVMTSHNRKSPFAQYFVNLWAGIMTTYVGMRLTFKHMFRPTETLRYPEARPEIPAGHRGIHVYDESQCSGCKLCARACPVDCITVESVGRGKDSMISRYDIDYTKCLFCELCTEPCPTQCILMGPDYDLSRYTREDCVVHFARPKSKEEVDALLAEIARKEAEKKAKLAAQKAAAAAAEKPAAEKPTTSNPADETPKEEA
jgi:NADH-quinone oxidoreductase subunit I